MNKISIDCVTMAREIKEKVFEETKNLSMIEYVKMLHDDVINDKIWNHFVNTINTVKRV